MVFCKSRVNLHSFDAFDTIPQVHQCNSQCTMDFLDDVYYCHASGHTHWCTHANCEYWANDNEEHICTLSAKTFGFAMTTVDEIKLHVLYEAKRTTKNDNKATRACSVDDSEPANANYKKSAPKPHKRVPKRFRRKPRANPPKTIKKKKPAASTAKLPGAKRIKTSHSSKIRIVIKAVLKEDKAKNHQTEALVTLVQLLWDIYASVPQQVKARSPYTIENHTLVTLYNLEKGINVSGLVFVPVITGLKLVGLKNLYQVRLSATRHSLQTRHVTKSESVLRNALRRAETSKEAGETFFAALKEGQTHIQQVSALLLSHL